MGLARDWPTGHPVSDTCILYDPKNFILPPSSILIPTQASSKIEMRAARRLVNLANQSPNPYFAGFLIGWPGRPKLNDLANQSNGQQHPCQPTNGVGCSNFKIGPISALIPSTNPNEIRGLAPSSSEMPTTRTSSRCLSPCFTKANFEIGSPDPNSNPPPTQKTPTQQTKRLQQHPTQPHNNTSILFGAFCNAVKKCISAVISPACKAITDQPKAKRRGGSRKAPPWVVLRPVKGTTILQGMDTGDKLALEDSQQANFHQGTASRESANEKWPARQNRLASRASHPKLRRL